MKQLLAVAAVLSVGLGLVPGGAEAAQASLFGSGGIANHRMESDHIQEVGHKKNKHHKKHRKHHKKKHHKHRHHNHHGNRHKHQNGGFFLSFGARGPVVHYGEDHQQYARKCHGVVTDGYFNGRYAKVGGTMCYDRAGNGYIVDGSRYLVHYY